MNYVAPFWLKRGLSKQCSHVHLLPPKLLCYKPGVPPLHSSCAPNLDRTKQNEETHKPFKSNFWSHLDTENKTVWSATSRQEWLSPEKTLKGEKEHSTKICFTTAAQGPKDKLHLCISQFVVPYMPSWPILDPEKKCPKGTERKLHEYLCSLRTIICVSKYAIYKQFTKGQILSVTLSSQIFLFINYYMNQSLKKPVSLLLKTS